jgi:hypothetical protein
VPVLPYHPAMSDDDVVPLRGLSHFLGSTKRKVETSLSVQVFFCIAFENRCIQVNAVIVTNLSLWYDDCRRPRRDAPAADR